MPATTTPAQFSILVACLFEEDTIVECLTRLAASAPNAEILVICGGPDRTLERAQEFAQTHPNVVAFRNEHDCGKGSAIKVGNVRARHELICQFDADLQFDPEDLPAVLAPMLEGRADVVIGSRFMPESDSSDYHFSFFRTVGNYVVNSWVSLMAGQRLTDVTTGYKVWTRAAIEKIHLQNDGFVYEVEIPVRACVEGLRVAQVPVKYHDRQGGVSGHGKGLKEIYSLGRCGFLILWNALLLRLRGRQKR